jgi:hypothetical protein
MQIEEKYTNEIKECQSNYGKLVAHATEKIDIAQKELEASQSMKWFLLSNSALLIHRSFHAKRNRL